MAVNPANNGEPFRWAELVKEAQAILEGFPDADRVGDPNERALHEWALAILYHQDQHEEQDDA